MKLTIYQVDAFADKVFEGNPAAVCPLQAWLPDDVMQSIAMENNLSETAFFVPNGDRFDLRWFTPSDEVDLCGHATLASAHVIFNHLGFKEKEIVFGTRSGDLKVKRHEDKLKMDFPAIESEKVEDPGHLYEALNIKGGEVYKSDDYMVILGNAGDVEALKPDFGLLATIKARGVIVTAKGEDVDFVSRFFAPAIGVPEDPVTGSTHTKLIPFWADKLNKNVLMARQLSKRGGFLWCEMKGERVEIMGRAVTYLVGEINI